jgi:hypothetical protein
MRAISRSLSRIPSKLLNRLFKLCWFTPVRVSSDERILRAIYSPFHVGKNNRLKHQAFDPTPKTDEISVMRLEHMGECLCKSKAKSFENPAKKKKYRGFAVLRVSTVRDSDMDVVDSRKYYCGHADVKLRLPELYAAEPGEPMPPELGKRLKDLKAALLLSSNYEVDQHPDLLRWLGGNLQPPTH